MNKEIELIFDNLKNDYDSGEGDDLGTDFFSPCLKHCIQYNRTTSDFTSNVIFQWGEAILKLVDIDNHPCKIRIIAHHKLHDEDKIILKEFLKNENELDKYLEKISEGIFDEALKLAKGNAEKETKLKMFAYLIATKRLELKFAFPHHVQNANVFHQKYGIFTFKDNLKIGFLGGPNETIGGYLNNIETIEVFNGKIVSDLKRISSWEQKFFRSWNDEAKGFRTKSISKKTLDRIISYSPESANKCKELNNNKNNIEKFSEKKIIKLWPHQQEAIEFFLKLKSGVLEMATGTGKTNTSLEILKTLSENKEINSCIVCTDGNSLLNQWYHEIINFFNNNFKVKNNLRKVFRHFEQFKETEKYLSNPSNSILIISRENLQKYIRFLKDEFKKNIFIIHDEVHGLGSPSNIKNLQNTHKNFHYKLGMSATPDREYGHEGNAFINMEIGKTFYKFSLEDAIKKGVLCKFDYFLNYYQLSEEENDNMNKIRKAHYAKLKAGEKSSEEDLAIKLSNIRKNAQNKISKFSEYIKKDPNSIKNTIIFVYSKDRGREISRILDGKVKYSEFFEGDVNQRLLEFVEGKLECLITCHRLSQGIDIQGLKNIFLIASDKSKLETIQRIGRCLRKNSLDIKKKAKVVDFVDKDYDVDKNRSEWLNGLSKIN
jgi:superfamily II DNA or RNA helicase